MIGLPNQRVVVIGDLGGVCPRVELVEIPACLVDCVVNLDAMPRQIEQPNITSKLTLEEITKIKRRKQ